jgi:hypothetical protein
LFFLKSGYYSHIFIAGWFPCIVAHSRTDGTWANNSCHNCLPDNERVSRLLSTSGVLAIHPRVFSEAAEMGAYSADSSGRFIYESGREAASEMLFGMVPKSGQGVYARFPISSLSYYPQDLKHGWGGQGGSVGDERFRNELHADASLTDYLATYTGSLRAMTVDGVFTFHAGPDGFTGQLAVFNAQIGFDRASPPIDAHIADSVAPATHHILDIIYNNAPSFFTHVGTHRWTVATKATKL